MLKKLWTSKPDPPEAFLKEFQDINPLVLKLLYNRGIKTQADMDIFFGPDYSKLHDPFLFNDMQKAVDRIFKAIESQEKIIVHGDYDADGVTSSALAFNTLKILGANVEAFIPHREGDGYGVNKANVQKFVDQGYKLMITVDCGTTNVEEIALAAENGLDVIVTDHHQPPPELPKAHAILNPHIEGEKYPERNLSGVGMAYKLSTALLRSYKGDMAKFEEFGGVEGYLKWILDIVAIGLIADIMNLTGENRILVKYGLLVLTKSRRIGLQKLAEVAELDLERADSFTVGYQIAPRINAAGRLDHARQAFDLLVSEDPAEAERLAWQINELNSQRRSVTDEALSEARLQVESQKDNKMLFVYGEDWAAGVIGLIAGRLCEAHYKPVMAMTKNKESIVGSGRSIHYFDVTKSLYAAEDLLARFGGHPQACGFTIAKVESLESFKEKLLEFADKDLKDKDLTPIVELDSEVTLKEASLDFVKMLETFQPFGEGNRKPQFLIKNLKITGIDRIGEDKTHLRIMVKQEGSPLSGKLMGFSMVNTWGELLSTGDQIDAIIELSLNVWNGRESVTMKVVDMIKK